MLKIVNEGLTFDDVLVIPCGNTTDVEKISMKTKFSKNIELNIPLVSAGMSTVTESRMAISIARQGGIGIIHKDMSIEAQVNEVDKVKRSEHGVITDPFYLSPNNYVYEVEELMKKYHISGVPITEHGFLVGIVTNRDLRFERDYKKKVYEVMTRDNLITAKVGTTMEEARAILTEHKVEKLPIIDDDGYLKGLITTKDIQKSIKYPNSAKDSTGRLVVAAAVTLGDDFEKRVDALCKAKVNALVLEGINGRGYKEMIEKIKWIKEKYPEIDVVAGNVITKNSAIELIEAGADGIKVGFGAGSTSAHRIITGVGMPQVTAIDIVAEACKEYNVPLLNDGGTNYTGDIVKALTVGADTVILGAMLAGTEEAPSKLELFEGNKYKVYKGISLTDPVKVSDVDKVEITAGVDARVTYRGNTKDTIINTLAALKLGLSYAGVLSIEELQEKGTLTKITTASLKESHPHFVQVTRDSPNYSYGYKNNNIL
ncbi:MAG: IMP dehydrogenase [Lachnospirales bacterium]